MNDTIESGLKPGDQPIYSLMGVGFLWTNAPAGRHSLTARASFPCGISAVSAPVNITIHPLSETLNLWKHAVKSGDSPMLLASNIPDADNILVTDYWEDGKVKFVVKGATVKKIVKAVSCGQQIPEVDNVPSWILKFYKGTNYLDCIAFEGPYFDYDLGREGRHEQFLDRVPS